MYILYILRDVHPPPAAPTNTQVSTDIEAAPQSFGERMGACFRSCTVPWACWKSWRMGSQDGCKCLISMVSFPNGHSMAYTWGLFCGLSF